MRKPPLKPSPRATYLINAYRDAAYRYARSGGDDFAQLEMWRARHELDAYIARVGELARQAMAYRKSHKALP